MLQSFRLPWLTIVLAATPPPAFAQSDARKLIEQAAEAHGGTEILAKYPAAKIKVKGTYTLNQQPTPYTGESAYWLPHRIHTKLEIAIPQNPLVVEQIQNGDRSAMIVAGLPQHSSDAQCQELKTSLYCREIERLAPLLTDSRFRLTAASQKEIQGKPAHGVRVSRAGHSDVTLYFDPQKHLLVGLERMGCDAKGGKTEQQEVFLEYKQAGGIKYPSKTVVRQNGQIVLESEVLEFVPLERLDEKLFTIPQ